jgi:hypothetical protein
LQLKGDLLEHKTSDNSNGLVFRQSASGQVLPKAIPRERGEFENQFPTNKQNLFDWLNPAKSCGHMQQFAPNHL